MSEAQQQHDSEAAVQMDAKMIEKTFRQLATYGMDTMAKLVSIKVLILGCKGVGAEAAKNLTLAGVHTVSLCDSAICSVGDQAGNFAVTTAHLDGKTSRAEATAQLARQLNPNCRVHVVAEATTEAIQRHDVVIVTGAHSNLSIAELQRVNDACRARLPTATYFMTAFSFGPIGSIFVDNGVGFVTKDPDGRDALQKAITEIVHHRVDKKGRSYSLIRHTVPEGMRPGSLRDRTEVTFSDVKGLKHTVTGECISAVKKPFTGIVGINDAPGTLRIYPSLQDQGYTAHETGGFIHEAKEVTVRNFRTFAECLAQPPAIILTDAMMDGTAENNAHLIVASLIRYADIHGGHLPHVLDAAAADEVVALAKAINDEGKRLAAERPPVAPAADEPYDPDNEWPGTLPPPPEPSPFHVDEVDQDFVRRVALVAGAQLQPQCALLGAIIAQEVVKVTGKFTPIYQWLHFNQISVLPDAAPADATLKGDRYDDIRAMFGDAFAEKLQNLKLFMVGCGALGCEYIKNFALCGICCGPNGNLTVTDNDHIEVSNLNRQFLFREDNVGQKKSVAAGLRAKEMNAALKIDPRTDFVGETTEHLFPDTFWASLDAVTNALDNMAARLYVDERCVLFEKVLVEAGTMGTGGNVDIIVPGKTTTYADGGKADDTGGIPMCTLRNFPYIYDHCIEWARAQFDDLFVAPMMSVGLLREDPDAFVNKLRSEVTNSSSQGQKRSLMEKNTKALQGVIKVAEVLSQTNVTMETCVAMAWSTLHAQFRDRILSLIKAIPIDAKKKNGTLFWSGHHKFPTALNADIADQDIFDFLVAGSNLFACMLGVHGAKHPPQLNDSNNRWMSQYRSREWLANVLSNLPVPPVSLTAVDDLDDESAAAAGTAGDSADDEAAERQFFALLDTVRSYGGRLSDKALPLDFEKDDDDNFHIDFVAAAANLRARNYEIPTKDRVAVKLIAGKIIPAIATTTAAVTGIALLEYFKVLQGKPVSVIRNGFIDVGGNTWIMFDRDPPKPVKSYVKKTYYPEQDYTEEAPLVAYPNPHNVYTKIFVDVTPATTMEEFGALLVGPTEGAEEGPYEISSVGVGVGRLWDGSAKHPNAKKPLLELIAHQLGKDATFWHGRQLYNRLAVNLDTADCNEVIPATIVLRISQ